MEFSVDFFRDEVRNGFYIPTAVKQAWAAELSVLSEIDSICVRHGITYYADWGSFLGAVRHGGFIPWDDDLDICMKRDDYEKFRSVADNELPEEYVIHDYASQKDHWLFLARVVNNSKMCFEEQYLNSHSNFPWLAGVDIFVKDYLYTDDGDEKQRDKEILNIIALADSIAEDQMDEKTAVSNIKKIKEKYHVSIPEISRRRDVAVALYALAEKQMARVQPEKAERIGQIFPWVLKNGPGVGEDKILYEETVRLPFENTTIPVPAYYNRVLSRRYGNYCEIRKVWDGHCYPFFEVQKAEMEQLMGESVPGFVFDEAMLRRDCPDTSDSLKTMASECVETLQVMLSEAVKAISDGDIDVMSKHLTDAQQLAVDLGTLMENVKGESNFHTKNVVSVLEEFCECLWQECQAVLEGSGGEFKASSEVLERVRKSVSDNIINVKEILFLPIGPKEWEGFKEAYEAAQKESDAEIWVLPLPLMRKDCFGRVNMTDEEIELAAKRNGYPDSLPLSDWFAYDPVLHHPDVIYVQCQYDGVNPCLTVPQEFYTRNLQKCTERIVFIPAFRTSEFSESDMTDQYNLKHYVTAPGIVYADKVYVQSENIRRQYINALVRFAGEDTSDVWEKKIAVTSMKQGEKNSPKRKAVLYCLGANELKEHKASLLEEVERRLEMIRSVGPQLELKFMFYPGDLNLWRNVDRELTDSICRRLEMSVGEGVCEVVAIDPAEADSAAETFDAYYGSPSPMVPAFVTHNKPVMISDYDIF